MSRTRRSRRRKSWWWCRERGSGSPRSIPAPAGGTTTTSSTTPPPGRSLLGVTHLPLLEREGRRGRGRESGGGGQRGRDRHRLWASLVRRYLSEHLLVSAAVVVFMDDRDELIPMRFILW